MHTLQIIALMAKDPAVSSIEVDCLQRADMSLPESDDSSPGNYDTLDQVEAVARRLDVQVGRVPWGIDRIDTNGEPAVRSCWRRPQLWLWLAYSSAQRASAAYHRAPMYFSHSSLAHPTGRPTDGEYDDGDLVKPEPYSPSPI